MFFFFFNDTATTEISTLSLHDALPILHVPATLFRGGALLPELAARADVAVRGAAVLAFGPPLFAQDQRSEEHTSELQSRQYLVCRLLLEKKKKQINQTHFIVKQTQPTT